MNDLKTKFTITADVNGTGDVKQLSDNIDSLANELNTLDGKAFDDIDDKAKKAENSTDSLQKTLGNVKNGLVELMSTLGINIGIQEIIQLSDEFNNLESRVRLATQSGGDFSSAMASLQEIANHTTMPLTATAGLFTKLTQATKELGYSQNEVLGLTKTISQAMAVSGGDMASMEAGLTQLAQGLSAGALRGDEFNSVVEQAPRLAAAMADGLGVTIGKLREMAGEGKLTAEVVGNALKSQSGIIAQEFAQMPQTVSGSLTVLKNNLMGFIGEMDNELSGSNGLANFILDIANNIKNIDPSVIDGLKNSLESVGVVAKVLLDSVSAIPNHLGDVLGAMMGLEAGAGQISLLQGLMNGLALTTGAVADGFKALQILIYGVIAKTQTQISNLASALNMLTGFGGDFAKSMNESATKASAEFEKLAMGFESSLGKAMNNIGKTSEQKLQEVADAARAKYDEMAKSGQASATALENAFKDYAHKAIQANGGVVDEALKQELAQKNLQAVIDKTGKVTIESTNLAKTAINDTTTATKQMTDGIGSSLATLDESLLKTVHSTNAKTLAITNNTKAKTDNAKVTDENTNATNRQKQATDNTSTALNAQKQALSDNTKAKADNATATENQTKAQSGAMAMGQALLAMINRQSEALKQTTSDMGLLSGAFEKIKSDVFRGGVHGFNDLGNKIQNLGKLVKDSVNAFKAQEKAVADAGQSLSKADVSTQDLAKAQSVLNQATSFSIAGLIKLDKAKLDGLRQQIEATKQKLNDLADTARQTRQNLESELANLQGNEQKARQIEQEQKLKALEKQLKEAQKRNNTAEINELKQAIALQRQIYQEKERQIRLEKQKKKQTQSQASTGGGLGNANETNAEMGGAVDLSQTAQELTGIWQERINEAEERGAVNFAKQLIAESKRRAN